MMKSFSKCTCFIWAGLLSAHLVPSAAAEQPNGNPNFAREVLPILSNKCFACHGPDAKAADMKLTSYEEATQDQGGTRPIDPDALEQSEILARLFNADDPMPPKNAEKQLTEAERDLLARWVRSGGQYAKHWAYVPPVRSTNFESIDDFIAAGLTAQGAGLAEEAGKPTLARRAALVLTGLPPEPEVLAAYLADETPEAYERLVDTLLADPGYGEHQARYWLDAVRYGDTHGLHLDNKRGIYPYRDWIIQALNANQPLDEFITWQLAGDLLPDPSLEQLVATGYVRMNPTTSEGGAIPEEFQAKNNFDRVETLGTAFLGMSLICSRCHTHKYDPIPQEEYYQLMAFFNSTAEAPLDGNSYDYRPNVKAPSDIKDWETWRALRQKVEEDPAPPFSAPDKKLTPLAIETVETRINADHKVLDDQSVQVTNQGTSYVLTSKSFHGKLEGFQLDFLPAGDPENGEAPAGETLLRQVNVTLTPPGGKAQELAFRKATLDFSAEPEPVASIVGAGPGGDWPVPSAADSPLQAVLVLKQEMAVPEGATLTVELLQPHPSAPLRRFRISAADNVIDRGPRGQLAALEDTFTTTLVAQEGPHRDTYLLERGEYNMPTGEPLAPGIVSVVGPMPAGAPQNRLGLAEWLVSPDNPLVARVLINRLWQQTFGYGLVRTPEEFGLQGDQPTHPELLDWLALTLHESGWDRKAMLKRMIMSKTFRQSSRHRADLADPENRLFGRGPSYRLDAEVLRDLSLWASGLLDPRMGGEGVKPYQPDGMWFALAHPASNTKKYVQDHGDKLYRRSLYVYWKRTSPHPMMTLFDAPNRETSCVRRSRSNTPLQSLALFNETQRVETARTLAERLLKEAGTDGERMDLLFELLACQPPSTAESEACFGLLDEMRARYASAPADAERLLSLGEVPRDKNLDLPAHAAWTQVASTVLASDRALLLY